tara:strand:+ start:139 stop:489 length:351 start_codon:yes stop_codon:yes gene_type:complete
MQIIKGVLTVFIVFVYSVAFSHPDGMKPYFYPSTYIYGFVSGCAETVEQTRAPVTEELWPDGVRAVCSCVVDALRHSVTFAEAKDDSMKPKMQVIVDATFPICVEQVKSDLANATN